MSGIEAAGLESGTRVRHRTPKGQGKENRRSRTGIVILTGRRSLQAPELLWGGKDWRNPAQSFETASGNWHENRSPVDVSRCEGGALSETCAQGNLLRAAQVTHSSWLKGR